MKYKDLKYYIDKDYGNCLDQIKSINLSKDLFCIIEKEVCESYFENFESFEYDNILFKLEKYHKYPNYAIIYLKDRHFGNGYTILSEAERIIKDIIE